MNCRSHCGSSRPSVSTDELSCFFPPSSFVPSTPFFAYFPSPSNFTLLAMNELLFPLNTRVGHHAGWKARNNIRVCGIVTHFQPLSFIPLQFGIFLDFVFLFLLQGASASIPRCCVMHLSYNVRAERSIHRNNVIQIHHFRSINIPYHQWQYQSRVLSTTQAHILVTVFRQDFATVTFAIA